MDGFNSNALLAAATRAFDTEDPKTRSLAQMVNSDF
jgi:hypothetical protein